MLVEEAVEGKFIRVWDNRGGVVLEGSHGESACKKFTANEGGVNWGGGGVTYVVSSPPGTEEGEMPNYKLSVSSA